MTTYKKQNLKLIGLLGGAFNPIHKAHLEICEYLFTDFHVDEVWFVVSYCKENNEKLIPSHKRIQMIKLAIKNKKYNSKIKINTWEIKQKKFIPTIDTLKYLSNKYNKYKFIFAFGSDHLKTIDKWQGFKKAHEYAKLICFQREGYQLDASLANKLLQLKGKFIMRKLVNVSSSEIRKGKLINFLEPKVLDYILENKLYIKEWTKNMLKDSPFKQKHCLKVANLMKKYAKTHNLDCNCAYLIGLFHDICRTWPKEQLQTYIKQFNHNFRCDCDVELHQYASAYYAKYEWGITNKCIYRAINCHTTMRKNMSKLDKLLYTLDTYESKKFKRSLTKEENKQLISLLETNIDKAFLFVLKRLLTFLENSKDTNKILLKKQKKIYFYYLEQLGKK